MSLFIGRHPFVRVSVYIFVATCFLALGGCGEDPTSGATASVVPVVVRELRVTPADTSLPVGSSLQLVLRAYTSTGTTTYPTGVVWESDHPEFAAVDSSGRVYAVAPGAASLRATVGGVSASALLTVNASPDSTPPPPPDTATPPPADTTSPPGPPPGGLHEPAGMTRFVDDDGSRLVPAGMIGTDPWTGANGFGTSHTALVSDSANPTGSGSAIEKRWTTGLPTDAAAKPGLISVWHWSNINPTFMPARTLYVRMRVWFSSNWPDPDGNLAGMKFFYLKTSKTNSNVLWTSKNPDGRLHWAAITRHGAPGNYFFDTWTGRPVLHPLGGWHTVEFLFTMNSALDVPDGRVQIWTDGAIVSDRTGVVFVGASDTGAALDFDGIEFYPLRGTVNYTFDRDDQFRLGELYISGGP